MHVAPSLLYKSSTDLASKHAKAVRNGDQSEGSFVGDFAGCSQTRHTRGNKDISCENLSLGTTLPHTHTHTRGRGGQTSEHPGRLSLGDSRGHHTELGRNLNMAWKIFSSFLPRKLQDLFTQMTGDCHSRR